MRKILSKEDKEQRDKKLKTIWGIFLGVILLLSVLGFAFNSANLNDSQQAEFKTIKYNGLDFTQNQYGLWQFQIQDYEFATNFNPNQTKQISLITNKKINNFTGKPLYFGINSVENIEQAAKNELDYNLEPFILRSGFSCLEESCTENYPIKNCSEDNVVVFKKEDSGFTRIREEEDCIVIYYKTGEALMASDRFLFGIFGIQ